MEWKYMLVKQQKAQIIRILRPKELHELIDNIKMEDIPTWTKSRDTIDIKEAGLDLDDIKVWLKFYLYAGCRFSEGLIIHEYRDDKGDTLYQKNGTLWFPRYEGKEKRTFQTRTIYFSNEGRKILDDFFDAPMLPATNQEGTKQVLTALSVMLHKAGERINLPEKTLTLKLTRTLKNPDGSLMKEMVPTSKFIPNPDGTYSMAMKEVVKKEQYDKQYRTNGCAFRSLRKTWESWLSSYYGNDSYMREKIRSSQGHTDDTAWKHYLEISFDNDDLNDIGKEVEGYANLD